MELLEVGLGQDPLVEEKTGEAGDRVALEIPVALGFGAVVRLVVGERVAVGTDDVGMDEGRPQALAAVLDRVPERVVGLEEVRAVDLRDEEVRVVAHELRDRTARRVDLDRHGDRVAVVLDEKQDGQLQVARRGKRFPELAFGRLPVSPGDVGHLVRLEASLAGELGDPALPPPPLGGADGVEELGPRAGRLGDDVQPLVPPVGGHLAPGRGRIVAGPDRLQEHLVGGDAELEDQGAVPVVRVEPVVSGLQDHPGGRANRLVPHAVDLKVDLVLALELDLFVVEAAGEVDVAVGGDEGPGVEASIFVGSDLGCHRASGREYTKGVAVTDVTDPDGWRGRRSRNRG